MSNKLPTPTCLFVGTAETEWIVVEPPGVAS